MVVGGLFGDEGKGKIVSYLALRDRVSINARGGVGPNAGHTVVYEGKKYKLRQLPSGFTSQGTMLLIGAGALVNPAIFLEEVEMTGTQGRSFLDYQTGVIEEKHVEEDRSDSYLRGKIGTTGTGCGPAQRDRVSRILKIARDVENLKNYLTDVSLEINDALDRGENVLLEGTQGTYISLYHGTYPYVTSKDVTAPAICSDVGVGPTKVDEVVLVVKAYVTRVGGGPLVGELPRDEAERKGWLEVATVTGRIRRSAPLDLNLVRRAVILNGATQIALTKLDILFPQDKGKKRWKDLSPEAKGFIRDVEEWARVPVTLIGTGEESLDIIDIGLKD